MRIGAVSFLHSLPERLKGRYLWVALIVMGIVYVANAWTPSHYGMALTRIGAPEAGPDIGWARPIRSDEWIVMTPNFQMAVRSNFEPINQISPYKENLKNFWALPLKDWSIAFKPQLWAFFAVDPAYAYSLYFYLMFAGFVAGWTLFFREMRIEPRLALLGCVAVLFSRLPQVWWTSNAPVMALAPWTALVFMAGWRWWIKLPVLFYVAAVWLFALLYPPFLIPLAFMMAVAMLAMRPEAFRPANLAIGATAATAAAGLVYLYFGEVFAIMRETVYPGSRIVGGGDVPGVQLLSHLLPFASAVQFKPFIPNTNECQIGVIGTFLPLMALIFADHRALAAQWRQRRWPVAVFAVGLLLMTAWMALPVPPWMGMPLLWHVVPGQRMLVASGLLLTIAVLVLFSGVPWHLTRGRLAAFAAVLVGAWLIGKAGLPEDGLIKSWWDGVPIVLLGLLVVARRRLPALARLEPMVALAGVAALTNLVTFGSFNPLQSAKPIFHPPETPLIQAWRQLAASHPQGWLVLEGHFGALPNGLGLPAINHVQVAPQLEFFRPRFAGMPPDRFNEIFNRYAHISLTLEETPDIIRVDHIKLPIQRFAPPFKVSTVSEAPPAGRKIARGGSIDTVEVVRQPSGRRRLTLQGWAPYNGLSPNQELRVEAGSATVESAWAMRGPRLDIAEARHNPAFSLAGLSTVVTLSGPAGVQPALRGLIAVDPTEKNRFQLANLLLVDLAGPVPPEGLFTTGKLDGIAVAPNRRSLELRGHVPVNPQSPAAQITVHTPLPVTSALLRRESLRGEEAEQGFVLTLQLARPLPRDQQPAVCLTGVDTARTPYALDQSGVPGSCGAPPS